MCSVNRTIDRLRGGQESCRGREKTLLGEQLRLELMKRQHARQQEASVDALIGDGVLERREE